MSTLTDDTRAKLERYLPIRVVLSLGDDGRVLGLTEESFSMGREPDRVNLFWSGKAYSILGEHQLDGVKWAADNAKKPGDLVFDPLAEDSPIEVDWERWLASTSKYDKRNARFAARPLGAHVLRAALAERDLARATASRDSWAARAQEAEGRLAAVDAALNPADDE
jgi:hypothetical protein